MPRAPPLDGGTGRPDATREIQDQNHSPAKSNIWIASGQGVWHGIGKVRLMLTSVLHSAPGGLVFAYPVTTFRVFAHSAINAGKLSV